MRKLLGNIIEGIGNTPLVEIRRLNPNKKVKIFAKLESANPGGSIKDRTALFMIKGAEERGDLTPDKIILEATSGNTGIGLAMIAAAKGYRLSLAMPESASEERKKILKAMGAELHFTPANLGTDGSIEYVYKLLRENPEKYFGTDQFNNTDNIAAHYHGTAQEIWQQTKSKVTAVVATLGTTGTAMGLSKRLKELNPGIRIIGVEPYLKHKIQGLKNMKESYRPGIFDKTLLDEKVNILDEDAFEMARRLAREEGILGGMSSGAAMFVAAQEARKMQEGVIVVIFPDSGERYLTTELFAFKEELPSFSLYNITSRQKTIFKPVKPGEITVHTCGPTVYDEPHLGNYRRFIVADMICRYLAYKGFVVKHVVDIVDITDKSIKGSDNASMNLTAYSDKYERMFLEDVAFLNIREENTYVKASKNIDEMLKIVDRLAEKNFAYEKLRSVYYDISKLPDYGTLSNIDLSKTRQGKSIDLDDYDKDSPADFALLKRSNLNELKRGIYYNTRWGSVRPSWHLGCVSVTQKYLGPIYDINIGGVDETFPHGENILAINKAFTGNSGANYWINAEMVLINGKKMSRSLDNTVVLSKLRQNGYRGPDIRFFLLGVNYRKPISFSQEALAAAKNTVKKINTFIYRLISVDSGKDEFAEINQWIYDLKIGFEVAMDDDLNIAGALAAIFEFMGKINNLLAKGLLGKADAKKALKILENINEVLGVMDFKTKAASAEVRKIKELIAKRSEARSRHNWPEADKLRHELLSLGVDVLDTPQGVIWRFR
ncbi:MAG TPA: cysteine--tRNA ligase [Deltaproteobacteria bacterium]|nr:cysteine--tRNA ligase [Deltaproteobacteria bacterium]